MSLSEWYAAGTRTSVDGLEVFHRRDGRGESLICLHGFPTSSWDFEPLWASLTGRFDVLASDLIGLGRSAKPRRALPVTLQATVVEALAEALGIREAHLFAHDLGDTVAQELLARQLDGSARVVFRSCVFLNGGLFPETHRPRLIQRVIASRAGPLVARLSSERTFRRSMRDVFGDAYPPSGEFLAGSWRLLVENDGRRMLPPLMQYMRERREQRERWVTPLVRGVVPMRLINGAKDPISGLHAADRYRALIPGADVVILDEAGHYPHVQQPGRVLEAFHAFHDTLARV